MKIVNVTSENASDHSFFCIKNTKEPGFEAKLDWFEKRVTEGLKLKVIYADDGKQIGFIEYVPAKFAWRPVAADGWLFIHCIMVYPNKYRNSGAALQLILESVVDAKDNKMHGVCTMVSQGPWMATKKLFVKHGFTKTDKKGRFELYAVKLNDKAADPKFIDWEKNLKQYNGWHLLYADQCPWHKKGVDALVTFASEKGINLNVKKINSSAEAKKMPAGFGVFALVKDGKLLEDHYISKTRFKTIVEKEGI
jgi:L-amino acid N-acyltransferase YncA